MGPEITEKALERSLGHNWMRVFSRTLGLMGLVFVFFLLWQTGKTILKGENLFSEIEQKNCFTLEEIGEPKVAVLLNTCTGETRNYP